jgi:hypothetical protein
MAAVNSQSVEDFADRIIYRYPAARFEQAAVIFESAVDPGLKTLVNTATSTEFNIPASGISARFYKVDWTFKLLISMFNSGSGGWQVFNDIKFLRYITPAPALNYDGKSFQTEFYDDKTEAYIPSAQLRTISITNIQVEPVSIAANYLVNASIAWDFGAAVTQLIALLQPVVTFYKKA